MFIFLSPVGQIWLFQRALGFVYMMPRDDKDDDDDDDDWVYCSLY